MVFTVLVHQVKEEPHIEMEYVGEPFAEHGKNRILQHKVHFVDYLFDGVRGFL
jgi:hypothetical protein